jgi:hypothetical protein
MHIGTFVVINPTTITITQSNLNLDVCCIRFVERKTKENKEQTSNFEEIATIQT